MLQGQLFVSFEQANVAQLAERDSRVAPGGVLVRGVTNQLVSNGVAYFVLLACFGMLPQAQENIAHSLVGFGHHPIRSALAMFTFRYDLAQAVKPGAEQVLLEP